MDEITIEKLKDIHNNRYDYSISKIKKPYGTNKIQIICKEHGIFEQTSYYHYKGQKCPKCSNIAISKNSAIDLFVSIHGNKYDYSLFKYNNSRNKEIIVCKKHGNFQLSYQQHKKGKGCPTCDNIILTNNVIDDFKITHNNKYDYSLFKYRGANIKGKIICKKHGIFEQRPNDHRRGQGCPKCGIYSYKEILDEFKQIHGTKYDYSLVEYKNVDTKVKIICREHGIFEQRPGNHKDGNGCPMCAIPSQTFIIDRFNKVHNNLYNYDLVEYTGALNKIQIICKEHGIFEQIAHDHTNGRGCPICANLKSCKEIYKNKRAVLYYIIINNIHHKVGITKTSVNKRYKDEIKNGVKIDILREIEYNDGYIAFKLEQEIIKKSQERGVVLKEDMILLSGYSETKTSSFLDIFDDLLRSS